MMPFGRAEARAAGISSHTLTGPDFVRLFHGRYVSAAAKLTPLLYARAALGVSGSDAHASHFTAARIWGGCVPDQPNTHVSSPRGGTRCERRGVKTHDLNASAQVVRFRGIRVSTPEQCLLDLATELSLVDLVVFGDSLVKAKRTTVARLGDAAARWSGPGAVLARRAASFVRKGVDSPMESRLRMLIVLAGLPEPQVNLILHNSSGDWVMRFDLSYPELKLIIEYDGRQHAEDTKQWGRDVDRREVLDRAHWRLVVVRADGIYVDPQRTLIRIVDAIRDCGGSVPTRLKNEWRQHFPGRPAAA